MRRDLIIGLIISLGFHGGMGWGPQLWARFFPAAQKHVAEKQTAELTLWVPPPIPEVPPDPTDPTEDQKDISTLAPPTLIDVPGNVQPESFTEVMAPPPPPNMGKPDPNMRVVPTGNFNTGRVQGNLGDVFNLADLDQQPQVRGIQATPTYPSEMKRQSISGQVILQFIVDMNGDTRDIVVINSTNREFETPAIQAVQKWKFRPGKKAGKNVSSRMQIPIAFNLSDEDN